MASINTDVSAHSLINLVYQYLKENGHEEAASVLRKHTPQVEVPNVDVSLNDIFKKWRRRKQKKKKDKSTQKTCAKEQTHSKGSAKLHSKSSNKGKLKDTSQAGPLSSNKKKTKTKKNAKNTSSVESQTTANSNTKETRDQDSDSDSSLDVEKWKKLALELSDVDIAKIDVFTNLSTSGGTAGGKSKKKVSKKDGTLIKGKSKPIKPQTKSTTATVPSEGEDTVLPSKVKVKEKNSTDPNNVETPSMNTASEAHCKEPRCKTPESKVGIKSTGSPKLNMANGISETGSSKDSEFVSGSMGENAEPEKTQEITKNKKRKSKKAIKCTEPIASKPDIIVENSQSVPDSVVGKSPPKKKKSKHAKITNSSVDITTQTASDISNFSNSERAETQNKKVKSKKSSKHAQPENDSTQETCITATEDSGTTVVTPCKQVKNKKSAKQKDLAMLSEESGTTAVGEQPQTPSKQAKDLKTTVVTSPSFKENTSFDEVIDTKTPSKTPSKKSKTKKSSNTDEDETVPTADCENVQDSAPKKRKRRKSEYSEENMHLPVTESELKRSKVDGHHDVCIQAGKEEMGENDDNIASVVEEDPSVPKRKKKDKLKKEDIDEPKVEDIPSTEPLPPPEEMADPILSSKKKKKKKKKSHGDEEAPNDAAVVPEEKPPKKKKKKSSKELEHATETVE